MAKMYCVSCGNITRVTSNRSYLLLIILLFIGLVPGIIYFFLTGKEKCRACGSLNVIPLDSPVAQRALEQEINNRNRNN